MADDHAFRAAGGPGGVHDVGRVRAVDPGGQRGPVVVGGQGALPGDGDQFGTEAGPLPDGRFVGEHQNRVGVVDDHLQAVDRVGLIEWQVTRPGLDHGQQCDDQVDAAGQGDADQLLGSGAGGQQAGGQIVGQTVELGIGDRASVFVGEGGALPEAGRHRPEDTGQGGEVGAARVAEGSRPDRGHRLPGLCGHGLGR